MRIDRTNYEIFFLDYFEGNLAPEQVEELMAFLEAEPDLKAEFTDFEMISLPESESVVFDGKASLKRGEVTPENRDWYFAAYAEGDLKPEEMAAVEAFAASNPQMQREFDLMMKARLQPEMNVVFPEKASLKRRKVIPLYTQMIRYGAAAAVILLMATMFFVRGPRIDTSGIAGLTEAPQQEPSEQTQQDETLPAVALDNETDLAAAAQPTTAARQTRRSAPSQPAVSSSSAMQPLLISGRLHTRPARVVTPSATPEFTLEQRNEFAYWHLRNRQEVLPEETETPAVSLFQLAYDGLQRNLPEDIRRMEQQLSESRPNLLLGLAGASLVGLNNLLGSPVNIETERDENGRLRLQFAISDAFELARK